MPSIRSEIRQPITIIDVSYSDNSIAHRTSVARLDSGGLSLIPDNAGHFLIFGGGQYPSVVGRMVINRTDPNA